MNTSSKNAKPVRWWDWPAALLLIAALFTAATRLTATHWAEHLSLVQTVSFLGAIAGLALGQSRFSPSTVRFFALAYGLFTVPWQLGLTLGEGVQWSERMLSVGNRLLITIDQLIQQRPVSDNMFFLFLMSSLFWSLSVYGGYSLTRHAHPWRAVVPAGLAVVIIQTYDSFFASRAWFLGGYFFFSLLLVARLHFLQRYNRWKQDHSYLPPYLGLDFVRTALIVTAVLILMAWTAPALASSVSPAAQAWRRISTPWNIVRDRLSNAFSSLQSSVGFVTDFYGDTLPLGRGNPLSDTVVMEIEAPPQIAAGVRYYWRGRIFDYYDGQWTSTLPSTVSLRPDEFDLNLPEYEGRSSASFTFTTLHPIRVLYTPAQPTWISRPVEAHLANNADETVDLASLEATPYLAAGEIYRVEASLSAPSILQLREAGTDYPEWVTDRYLQLPDSITLRTRELAARITEDLDNPYDMTDAITNFLRNNLTYSEIVPLTPAGQEPIDWILFDHREAFCNYYATAQVIMLRSIGIPARLAVGFAEGERQALESPEEVPTIQPRGENIPQEIISEGDLYTVRHRDAHAWPEVYFPGLGWVEFEPTSAQVPILRPSGVTPFDDEDAFAGAMGELPDIPPSARDDILLDDFFADSRDTGAIAAFAQRYHISPTLIGFVSAALGISLLILLARRIRRQRGSPPIPVQLESGFRRVGLHPPKLLLSWVRLATLSALTRSYLEINRALSRLGSPPNPTDTPSERASNLCQLLPSAEISIQKLVVEYQAATYSTHPGDEDEARRYGSEIRKQSFLALLQRLFARFQEPIKRQAFSR